VPVEYLQPIAGEQHGGQVVLLPGGRSEVKLDPALAAQGVVFTDLATAEHQHPKILQKIPGSGGFVQTKGSSALWAAAMAQSGVLVYVPAACR